MRSILWKSSFLCLTAILLVGCFGKASFRGEAVDPSAPAGEIDLPDQNGNNFRLSEMRGHVVLVFFGFTNCVDECPLTMAYIKLALEQLGDSSQNVRVVLVSTDPVRDSRKALKGYLDKFNPSFVGITGAYDDLKTIWDAYGVTVLEGGETHSSFTYMIDKNGNLRATFEPEAKPEDIAHDLDILLSE
ncbi:MAG: SCO family protein [Anaerolineales bacterium]